MFLLIRKRSSELGLAGSYPWFHFGNCPPRQMALSTPHPPTDFRRMSIVGGLLPAGRRKQE